MSLLGLDVGITGCKAVIFSPDGRQLARSYREYPLHIPHPGWMELDPEDVWHAVQTVIQEAAAAIPGDPVRALSVSTHGESVLPIDQDGRPLSRFLTALDTRATAQTEWWEEQLGRKRLFRITGMPLHPMYTINKIMWLRQHQPDIYSQAKRFLCMEDFILHRLGLPPTIDHSLAARTMAFDIVRREWSVEILSLAQVDPAQLSTLVPSGTVVGKVHDSMAEVLGLAPGVLAVTGGHDQPCGALGVGVISEGIAMDSTGTVECLAVAWPRPVLDDVILESNLPCAPHVVEGLYTVLGYTSTAGGLLRWYRDNFAAVELAEAQRTGCDVYDLILAQATKEPADVFVLPHFIGSGTPWMDPNSKGAILGLTLSTDKGQIIKALLDSITYETRLSLDAMLGANITIRELRAHGGGARSPLWLQLKADIFNLPVMVMDVAEAACLGTAILSGVAAGEFGSIREGVARMVRIQRTYVPDPERHARYEEKYRIFTHIYPALAELNHQM
ncbi:MAG TPA: hypothetical protein EYH31_03485 [Anaerolineae bacterium]|nr:hypothetical protein [Anaerolineae bacterium]